MSVQSSYTTAVPGVEPSTLRSMNVLVGTAVHLSNEDNDLHAEMEARIQQIRHEYQPAFEEIGSHLKETYERIVELFIHHVMETAENADDIKTIHLPHGTIEWRKASSDKITITDKDGLLAWASEEGVLRKISRWKRTIYNEMIEQLLADRPELRNEIEGIEITRTRTLAIRTAGNSKSTPIFTASDAQEPVL